ncbi:MAG: ATP-grasp domain-containing protein [Candidatus Faecivivens sp.]|nr:ATP-grasp domain-containing protein [Oscillospiraceae bacterium]MDY2713528.1 ATP-grasp domain-containing protein [Candidatus Faecivivens sp.]
MSAPFIPVLLGTDVNVYGMARSFHEAYGEYGVTSYAIGKKALGATSDSKIVKVAVVEPDLEDDAVFVKTLVKFAEEHQNGKKLLLVPCGDNYIKLLVRNQEALRPYYVFTCIDEPLLMRLSIKESFYQVCTEHGFEFPKTTTCNAENYKTVELPFDFPCIIKPSNSVAYWNCTFPHKKKVFLANNKEEFDAILNAIYGSSYQDHLILQEYIPGPDSQMRVMNCYCGKDKKVKLISLGHALLEEQSPEGIGSYAAIINTVDRELSAQMKDFLEDIGYTGFANFDMKLDPRDGKYKLFEMNLRQGRSSFFVTAAGYNLATFLVNDLILDQPMGCVIAEEKALWSIIPKYVIFKYTQDEALKEEAKELIHDHRFVHSFYYEPDLSFKRRIYYLKNQLNYVKKYKKYFGNKGLHE